jgi:hypothetical protein
MIIPLSNAVIAMTIGRAKRCMRGFKAGSLICSSEHITIEKIPVHQITLTGHSGSAFKNARP